jgi:hypothetical protein
MRAMFRSLLSAVLIAATAGFALGTGPAAAADSVVPEASVDRVKRIVVRHPLPAGLPRAHYRYRTTIIAGPPVPYDARPFAYGRYPYAPYTNSYGIPARVIIDPVDPALLWRPLPYDEYYGTPYSCFYYGSC